LAIDSHYIPLGVPIWLSTSVPNPKKPKKFVPYRRLLIGADTGGAINGPVRGDIYFGAGHDAWVKAAHMRRSGRYWILVPRSVKVKTS